MEELRLTVALLGGDDLRFRAELRQACEHQGHRLLEASRLRELRREPLPDVLLLDSTAGPEDVVDTALALGVVHPHMTIILVGDGSVARRGIAGFRVLDRWRSGERLVDELELAWIGIPPSVAALGT